MIQVVNVEARSILSPASGYIGAYDYTLSPYIGCGFGCSYCYVPTLYYVRRDVRESWGKLLLVKANAVQLLRREGEKGKLARARIFWSPNTDPLQLHERRLPVQDRLFHRLLAVFAEFPPRVLVIQTRAPWIDEHVDLLKCLGQHVVVAMTISTDDDGVRKQFEPECASIRQRVHALATLHSAGIRTQASLAPLLPCDPDALAEVVGPHSSWVVVQALKMRGPGARTWAPAVEILEEHGWKGWLQDGEQVKQAMRRLKELLGPRYHEGQEGFSFPAVQG